MEEKKVLKISLKTAVILSVIGIIALIGIIYFIVSRTNGIANIEHYQSEYYIIGGYSRDSEKPFLENERWKIISSYEEYNQLCQDIDNYLIYSVENNTSLNRNYYSMEQSYSQIRNEEQREKRLAELKEQKQNDKEYQMEYQREYQRYYNQWYNDIPKEKFNKEFFANHNLLIVDIYKIGSVLHGADIKKVSTNNNTATVSICESYGGVVGGGNGIIHYIVVDKNINNVKLDISSKNTSQPGVAYKPIIYLYPAEETQVTVTVGNPEKLTYTYPKYENSWNVLAKPNGDLIDLKTERSLYALYWEGINTIPPNISEGFVVEGKDAISFLEEKLAILGLTEREANEFIIYWLPQLESNKYNFIRFQTMKEIDNNMPLDVTPTPDTTIRIMMEFKGLDKMINVKEQLLETPQRNGFVVVEWGGTEIY